MLYRFHDGVSSRIRYHLTSCKTDIPTNSNKESNLVNIHDVNGNCYVPISLIYNVVGIYVVIISTESGFSQTCLPFKLPTSGPKISSAAITSRG
jgi:hypothetical protein